MQHMRSEGERAHELIMSSCALKELNSLFAAVAVMDFNKIQLEQMIEEAVIKAATP